MWPIILAGGRKIGENCRRGTPGVVSISRFDGFAVVAGEANSVSRNINTLKALQSKSELGGIQRYKEVGRLKNKTEEISCSCQA